MRVSLTALMWLGCCTVLLHIVQVTWYYAPQRLPPAEAPAAAATASRAEPSRAPLELMVVTATQPAPCTTVHGDHMVQLALKNKWQYAGLHGYGTWASTELLSPWDLGGQWNKVALLSVLAEAGAPAAHGAQWLMWVDDDAIFVDMNWTFPLARYAADGIELVMWGDDAMTYERGDSEGINTGTMLLRVSDWSRELLAAWAALASSPIRESLRNHDQGGLVHLLFTQPERWRARTRLERDFTMNGHWPEYVGRFARGQRTLKAAVWGNERLPFLLHFSGCQMCRGHSFNGTWTEAGVDKCRAGFLEAFTFADDQVLETIGMRHTRLGMMTARANPGTLLQKRHARLTRCMPAFLVVGTQKGGTSSLHYVLKNGWHAALEINAGEKEIHYFALDDTYAQGAAVYQQRWDGERGVLGECPQSAGRLRGEVSASYLDYPKAAERAAALVPAVRVVALLREPVARISSSFNMRWQIEVCGKLTWTRPDCFAGITARAVVRDNMVGPWQKAQALKVWAKCSGRDGHAMDAECLRGDFVGKLRNRTRLEMAELDDCRRTAPGEPLASCLGLGTLGQRKLYKKMEDSAFVYRSMYHEHLQHWLRFFPASQLLVLPSEALFDQATIKQAMGRLARFLGIPSDGAAVRNELLFTASTASTSKAPHENGRAYVAEAPPDVVASLNAFLCAKNRKLAELLVRQRLAASADEIPWLPRAIEAGGCGGAAGGGGGTGGAT